MDAIGLAEMETHALMNRIDTKYVLSADYLAKLLANTREDYRVLSVEGIRLSPYRTLYFDTPDYECYIQHHNGKLNRRKFRIRQYQSSGIYFLEVKSKCNKGRTDKQRIMVDDFQQSLSVASRMFIESITGNAPILVPKIWTDFTRVTLVNRLQPERVTLDLDLRFVYEDVQKEMPGAIIAEVKQENDNRHSPIREYLRGARIRPMRVSKYCLGTALLKPELKSNRFQVKLRAIRKISCEFTFLKTKQCEQ